MYKLCDLTDKERDQLVFNMATHILLMPLMEQGVMVLKDTGLREEATRVAERAIASMRENVPYAEIDPIWVDHPMTLIFGASPEQTTFDDPRLHRPPGKAGKKGG